MRKEETFMQTMEANQRNFAERVENDPPYDKYFIRLSLEMLEFFRKLSLILCSGA